MILAVIVVDDEELVIVIAYENVRVIRSYE
jgi:hypothetical protein